MRIGKKRPASGKLVDIRCFNQRMTTHASNPVVLIVDREKEDVWLVGKARSKRKCEEGGEKKNESIHKPKIRIG